MLDGRDGAAELGKLGAAPGICVAGSVGVAGAGGIFKGLLGAAPGSLGNPVGNAAAPAGTVIVTAATVTVVAATVSVTVAVALFPSRGDVPLRELPSVDGAPSVGIVPLMALPSAGKVPSLAEAPPVGKELSTGAVSLREELPSLGIVPKTPPAREPPEEGVVLSLDPPTEGPELSPDRAVLLPISPASGVEPSKGVALPPEIAPLLGVAKPATGEFAPLSVGGVVPSLGAPPAAEIEPSDGIELSPGTPEGLAPVAGLIEPPTGEVAPSSAGSVVLSLGDPPAAGIKLSDEIELSPGAPDAAELEAASAGVDPSNDVVLSPVVPEAGGIVPSVGAPLAVLLSAPGMLLSGDVGPAPLFRLSPPLGGVFEVGLVEGRLESPGIEESGLAPEGMLESPGP